jgi:phosphatidylinositol alpha-1,6-mannosyltransferase
MPRRLVVSAQHLQAGKGGIGRVARLSVLALQKWAEVQALAVEDESEHCIANISVKPYHGNRARFLMANAILALKGSKVLYDFAGTARANLPGLGLRSHTAIWVHGYELWNPHGIRPDYLAAIRRGGLILVNSHYTLARVEDAVGNIPEARVCWLGTEQDVPGAEQRLDGIPRLLFVGRHDEMFAKGQDRLIDVWPDVVSKIPQARLVFAGGGTHLSHLITVAKSSPAAHNIDIFGFRSDGEMEPIWQSATAFAMLSHVEGFGLVFVEAMRHALPILASLDDASQEVNVDGVTGFNVSRTDRDGIIDRIVALLGRPDEASALGQAGLKRWQQHFRFRVFQERLGLTMQPWLQSQ